MTPHKKDNRPGIYCIRNLVNNKIYVGKSQNIFKRIRSHIKDIKWKNPNENHYLRNAGHKYGLENFDYYVLEYLTENETILAQRELFWIKHLDSLNKDIGYNLRSDSDSKCIVHQLTRDKISKRVKKEWEDGVRNGHSEKLVASRKNDTERKRMQSEQFSKNLTKYAYFVDGEEKSYSDLKVSKLHNCNVQFGKKKTNTINFKGHVIKKLLIEDIVQAS